MTRRFPTSTIAALLLAWATSSAVPTAAQDLDSLATSRLGTVASGAVVGVYHPEEDLNALSAWGTPSHQAGEALGERAVFPFPALTDVLIATTVRSLAAAGALDTEVPIARFLPRLPAAVAQVTLDQLLRHTAGLDDAPHPEGATLEEIVDGLPGESAFAPPGVVYSRSRYSYPLAARVLEVVTNMSIEDVIETAVFAPLGMTTSTFDRAEAERSGLATGYGAAVDAPGTPVPVEPVERVGGIRVLYTSVPDLLQLMGAWMGGALAAGPGDLPPAPPLPSLEEYMVDGLWRDQYQLLEELARSSQALGHSVVLRGYPETGTVVAGWTNFEGPGGGFGIDPSGASALPGELVARTTERLLGPDVPVTVVEELPDTTAVGDGVAESLEGWEGTYVNGAEMVVLRTPETPAVTAELAFFDGERELSLERLADGSVVARVPDTGQTALRFRLIRDEGDRAYVFLGSKAYRRVEE